MLESDIICRFFKPTLDDPNVIIGVGDDAAVLEVPSDAQLVVTTDTLIENVHFPKHAAPGDIALRALVTNLSDLAAMGAAPRWLSLALSMPQAEEAWLEAFHIGLFQGLNQYDVALIGGDLTRSQIVSITITAQGIVPKNKAILCSAAQAGDDLWLSRPLGLAAAALDCLQKNTAMPIAWKEAFFHPKPEIDLGIQLRGVATAATDVSDGFNRDLKKILDASGVGATVFLDRLPMPLECAVKYSKAEMLHFFLNGGDDYALCFTAPPAAANRIATFSNTACRVGQIESDLGIRFLPHLSEDVVLGRGYEHFIDFPPNDN